MHFLRFELTPSMITAASQGASIGAGIEHPAYPVEIAAIPAEIRDSLAGDLQPSAIN